MGHDPLPDDAEGAAPSPVAPAADSSPAKPESAAAAPMPEQAPATLESTREADLATPEGTLDAPAEPEPTPEPAPVDSPAHAAGAPDAPEAPEAEDTASAPSSAPKKLTARGKRIIAAGVIAAVLAVVGAGLAMANSFVTTINQELTQGDKTVEEVEEIQQTLAHHSDFTEPFYMLLIGSDARPDDPSMGARSDTNILARVDPTTDQVTLVSIPRDTKITIPGHGTCKFNAAYAYGGVPGVIRATNELLGIEVSHYAEVNFDKLIDLVDAMGGVEVDVDVRIDDVKADYNTYDRHNVIEPGLQVLDGSHALTFARSRAFPDGDFTRTAHQRTLIMAIVNQALGLSPTRLPGVVEAASKCVTTDLTLTQILDLAMQFRDEGGLTIYSAMLPSFTQNIGGVSYVINDAEATKEMMALVEAGEDPSSIVSTKTAADVGGSGGTVSGSASAGATAPSAPQTEQPSTPAAPEQPSTAQPGTGTGSTGAGSGSGTGSGATTPSDTTKPSEGTGSGGAGGNGGGGGSGSTPPSSGGTGNAGAGSTGGGNAGSGSGTGTGGNTGSGTGSGGNANAGSGSSGGTGTGAGSGSSGAGAPASPNAGGSAAAANAQAA